MPKISVIVPCFKQAQYLPEALNSVLAQTYQDWECIIVNDGSPDNTEEVALEWCKKDSKFKYFKKENGGLSSARNFGITNCSGEFILPLDADDKIGEKYLEKAINIFNDYPSTKLIYCIAELFGEKTGKWELKEYNYENLLFENIIFCSALFRKTDYCKTRGYNENLIDGWEDWDFWITLLDESDIVYQIPEICFFYRFRKNSMGRALTEQKISNLRRQIYNNQRIKYQKYVPALIWENPVIISHQLTISLLEDEIRRIQHSKAYRLGKFMLKPLSKLKASINA